MELFVINRHGEEKESNHEKEQAKLDKLLKQVDRKKQQRIRQREREREKKLSNQQLKNKKHAHKDEPQNGIDHTSEKKLKANKKDNSKVSNPSISNFTILDAGSAIKQQKTERVLPHWLANPTLVSSNLQELTVKVSKIKNLDKGLRQQLKASGIQYLFPVQAEVIPCLLEMYKHRDVMIPRDVCVSAPTGSGKTLTFALPVIQALKDHSVRKIRALVILPTQDLAEQVFKTFKTFTQGTNIEVGLVTGKHLFNAEQRQLVYFNESFGFVSKIDIVVCTAGRLVSHIKMTEGFNLQSLEFLIIDEADRVLENVQDDWLHHLEKHILKNDSSLQNRKILNLCTLRKQRSPQKLLFSATLTQDPEKIQKLTLFQPKLFSAQKELHEENIGKYVTPNELTEKYIVSTKDLKPLVLYRFIKTENLTKTIIFTHSVETTHRLKILLQSLFKSKRKIEEISSSLNGNKRDRLISDFSKGEVDLLICTDFLARGIDLPGVNCVISYSAPKHLKTYIHRVGRTARAGETGLAVTILHNEQISIFKSLLKHMKKEIEQVEIAEEDLESLGKRYKKALDILRETITTEEQVGIKHILAKKKSVKK